MLNNLYKVLEKKENFLSIKLSEKDHEVFRAHFPQNPLLPGFILIDICEKEFHLQVKQVKKISFLKSIFPNENIEFKISKNKNFYVLDVVRDENVVAFMKFEVF